MLVFMKNYHLFAMEKFVTDLLGVWIANTSANGSYCIL